MFDFKHKTEKAAFWENKEGKKAKNRVKLATMGERIKLERVIEEMEIEQGIVHLEKVYKRIYWEGI